MRSSFTAVKDVFPGYVHSHSTTNKMTCNSSAKMTNLVDKLFPFYLTVNRFQHTPT